MAARDSRKGIAWLPIAVGVIFLVQILVFSLLFTKFTILNREVIDSNIVFEGSEMETYTRSLEASAQMSIAAGIYGFYDKHKLALWQSYGSNLVPSSPDVESQVGGFASEKFGKFVEAHKAFSPDEKGFGRAAVGVSWSGSGLAYVEDESVSLKLSPEVELTKDAPGIASFDRKFLAETGLVTVFGKMMGKIRDVIQGDQLGTYLLRAIGRHDKPDKFQCQVDWKEGVRELDSYINDRTAGNRIIKSQTGTTGYMEFCSKDVMYICSKSSPSSKPGPGRDEPAPDEVYKESHGLSFGDGEQAIVDLSKSQHVTCMEAELDQSEDYTVSFGDFQTDVVAEASITSPSCTLKNVGLCDCQIVGKCGSKTNPKKIYKCSVYKKKTCDYDHASLAKLDKVRFQEDGFVYPFKETDSLKLVFKMVSGNMQSKAKVSTATDSSFPDEFALESGSETVPDGGLKQEGGELTYYTDGTAPPAGT